MKVAYYFIRGNESAKEISALAASLAKTAGVSDLQKAVAAEANVDPRKMVVFDSLESLEKYHKAYYFNNTESAPQVGFIWIESHVDISLTNDAAPRSHYGPRPQTKVLDMDSSW